MELLIYALIVGALVFWGVVRIVVPKKTSFASNDFIRAENIEEVERKIVSRSFIHQLVYPIYERVQSVKPTSKGKYDELEKLIEEAGEYDSTPEDIQIAQIFGAAIYPLIFIVLSFFMGEYQIYVFLAGIGVGVWMYKQPIRRLKSKIKVHDRQMLEDMTRFTTIFMLISEGNKTPYDSLIDAIERVSDRSIALGPYLGDLLNDMKTRPPEEALRRFSERLHKFPYVERFVNNIVLMMQKGDSDDHEINIRLRETLNEMDNQMINEKIEAMKVTARVPTYASVALVFVYMMIMIFVTTLLMFG